MRSLALLCLLAVCVPAASARPPAKRTGRYIVKLKARPTPPRLQAITERIEANGGEHVAGGRRSPYLLIAPEKPTEFVLPRPLKTLVDWVEPEIEMYLQAEPEEPRPFRIAARGPTIGEPARGRFDGRIGLLQTPSVPNDPGWEEQWGLFDTGFGVKLPTARGWGRGAGVLVGVIDSGVRANLSDLKGVEILPSYNALATRPGGTDDNGHGSHVTGTIAQATDNGVGCAGIAPKARILPIKVTDASGRGSNFTLAAGIRYAADAGCRVANMSVGGAASRTLQDAVKYAHGKGMLMVASAGNSATTISGILYPARYPEVVAVGAIDRTGRRCAWSQYGPGLALVAPGHQILQQTFNRQTGREGYFKYSGTSMAAPHVTGIAALLLSLKPSLTLAELRAALTGTATDLGPRGPDPEYGAGLVNAAAACAKVAGAAPPVVVPPIDPQPFPPLDPEPKPTPTPDPGGTTDANAGEVLRLHNMERSRAGLSALRLDPQLTEAARAHAADMAAKRFMSHTGSDGSNPGTRISRAGYVGFTWGENVAAGYTSPDAVCNAWMNSTGHRANILNANFRDCGIARVGNYWCVTFGAKR